MSQCDAHVRPDDYVVSFSSKLSAWDPTGTHSHRCEREAERTWLDWHLCLPHYKQMKKSEKELSFLRKNESDND